LIDGGKYDFIASDVNDDAASGEIGDDFVSALAFLGRQELRGGEARQEKETQRYGDNPSVAVCGQKLHSYLAR